MSRRFPLYCLLVALLALWGWSPDARAATVCTATTPTVLAFGNASNTQTTDTTTTFTVTCATAALALLSNTKVTLCVGLGPGSASTSMAPRQMRSTAGDILNYQAYKDPARSQIWGALGNASNNVLVLNFDYAVPLLVGGSQAQTVTIYGRIPANQALATGSYSSTFANADTVLTYAADTPLLGAPANFPSACNIGGSTTNNNAFPFTANAQVPGQCYAYSTTDLDFGSVAGFITSNVDQTSTIGLTCTLRTAWQLGLDNGTNALLTQRRMRQGASTQYVNYELYRDGARSNRWGNSLDTDTLQGTGTGTAQTATVYGRVLSGQTANPGSYSDTITVTITY
ncbi:Spore coat protein U (SCPU) domain-containing protein [Pseudoxanthomonas sp. GM95]|uniref:Csu type fimbrial protein n=1 Tax=Pseudoxanthomonas sp. GM95 TaxID=1881043 RepID=UPI0008CD6352|nr:spore coat U domain-containing protein [Pseudoxanthomonas sp. GM95]SEL80422.1 Spore coat protein U (SCPU) domain-containing protein [Pseudoxanthomonas sp. GM95]